LKINFYGESAEVPRARPAEGAQQQQAQQQQHQQPHARAAHNPQERREARRDYAAEQGQEQARPQPRREHSGRSSPFTPAPNQLYQQQQQQQQPHILEADDQTVLMPLSMFGQVPGLAPAAVPLEHLSDEELRAMEGNERKHIEERIRFLQGIQNQISGVIVQLSQYQQIASPSTPSSPFGQPQQQQQPQRPQAQRGFSFGASSLRHSHPKEE